MRSNKMRRQLAALASGGVLFGWLQAAGAIDFNQVFFELVLGIINAIVGALFGGFGGTV